MSCRPSIEARCTATETQRRTALRTARYGTGAKTEVLALAARRAWTVPGGTASVDDAALVWRPAADAGRLEPAWQVPVRVDTDAGEVEFVGVFDAVDGRLLDVTREARWCGARSEFC